MNLFPIAAPHMGRSLIRTCTSSNLVASAGKRLTAIGGQKTLSTHWAACATTTQLMFSSSRSLHGRGATIHFSAPDLLVAPRCPMKNQRHETHKDQKEGRSQKPRSLTAAILSALGGTSAVVAASVWVAPSPPTKAYPSQKEVVVDADDTVPSPPARWFSNPELMTFGGALGICTGYFTKKVSKLVAFAVGAGFVLLQLLVHAGFITVQWSKGQKYFNKVAGADEHGHVPPSRVTMMSKSVLRWLTADLPFASAFIVGFCAGLKYG
ncbi:uncharacterized protein SPPG_05542 [Spizellomyces punctatus DAOM BR117]|uniref:FUN14 family protein n=1 Tax=Spizellomyces punctatus (strain DAOM BR117) TaxID=645134 RepID=A0A0L0HEU6_SPIPD|nr:uncharacterized protein SPPG_05542 [Spizellomyces punctatus DAOM BR117]KNC99288.1 hypothetical protein SPPG_05542 [Spizellomyces punctatus DAOM BR117]|eukprot:XP_016607328.1 hypothetical protein SPPG_05542 [Spizellomyces punctatus DAOM BR117]